MIITNFSPLIGGAEVQARLLSNVLISKGLKVEVLTRKHKNWFKEEIIDSFLVHRRRGLPLLGVFSEISTSFVFCFFLFKKRRSFDIIHLHQATLLTSITGFFGRFFLKKKVICKIANSGEKFDFFTLRKRYKFIGSFLVYILIKGVDIFISLNNKIFNQLIDYKVSNIEIIPNGVNIGFSMEKNNFQTRRIISTSRLTPQKNIDSLIIAFSKLLIDFDDVVLCIYGDGPLRENLNLLASSLNIPKEKILFFGNVSDTKNIFNYGDIFVLPSFVEGMSNSLLEAMSLGVPCVVSNIQENVEVFLDKDAALFFDPYNSDDFVEKLKLIIESDSLYDYLSFKGVELSLNKYNIEFIAEKYINVYKKMLFN